MGLFDFGDRAMVQTHAYRVGVGMLQVRGELNKSTLNILEVKGIISAICEEMKKMMTLANSLSQSSRSSLKVDYNGAKINYDAFITSVIVKFQSDLMSKTQINLYSYVKLVH